jgi:hypothetical protein
LLFAPLEVFAQRRRETRLARGALVGLARFLAASLIAFDHRESSKARRLPWHNAGSLTCTSMPAYGKESPRDRIHFSAPIRRPLP